MQDPEERTKRFRTGRFRTGLAGALALFLACNGDHIGRNESAPDVPPFPQVSPPTRSLPRLTQAQYQNALHSVFGNELVTPSRLEPDVAIDGLAALGASESTVSHRGTEQYEKASFDVAEQIVGPLRDSLLPCAPASASSRDDECALQTLRSFGRRLWRRPLVESEINRLVDIAGTATTTLGDYHEGLAFGIAALLQSPHFLYRHETPKPGSSQLDDYSLASRLSFFLWNTVPDEKLLDAAAQGRLSTDQGLAEEVERMIADPQTRAGVRNFFTQLYNLAALDELVKDTTRFQHMNAQVGPAAREETLLTIEDHIFDLDADFRELFSTNKTFLNRQLAAIYGVRAPDPDGFAAFYWPEESPRRGILTQVSVLAQNSHPIDSSPTLRGKFIRKVWMCDEISPPPVDVDASLPEPSPDAKTLRERLASHVENESCAGCHIPLDSLGLGLENFDALGQFRTHDNGVLIDASGDVDGELFTDPTSMAYALSQNRDIPDCLVERMYRYATYHVEESGERELLKNLQERFAARGYRVLDLVRDIVMSPGFRQTGDINNEVPEGESK